MTACVNRKHTKKVAAVVTASLVGALSLGVAPVAAMAEGDISLLATDKEAWDSNTIKYTVEPNVEDDYVLSAGETIAVESVTDVHGQPVEDYTVVYFKYDATAADAVITSPTAESTLDGLYGGMPSAAGSYYIAVIEGDVASTKLVSGKKLSEVADSANYTVQKFTVEAKGTTGLSGVFACENKDTDDTAFQYSGGNIQVSFAKGKTVLANTAYDVKWTKLPTGAGNPTWNTDHYELTEAGEYTAELTGKGSYKGSSATVTFTVSPLDLADITIAPVDTATGIKGLTVEDGSYVILPGSSYATTLKANGVAVDSAAPLKVELIAVDDDTTGISTTSGDYTTAGKYTFRITPTSAAGSNVTGEKAVVDTYIVNTIVSYFYDGDAVSTALANSFDPTMNLGFDASKLSAHKGSAISAPKVGFTYKVLDAEGNEVEAWDEPGEYTLVLDTPVASGFDYAGHDEVKFTVAGQTKTYGTPDWFVSIDGKNIVDATGWVEYDGEAVKPLVTLKDGKVTLVEGEDYTLETTCGDEAVEEVKDPGTYVITATMNDTAKTTYTFTFTVRKANIESAKPTSDFFATDGETAAAPSFTGSTDVDFDKGQKYDLAADQITVRYYAAEDTNEDGRLDGTEMATALAKDAIDPEDLTEEGWYVADIKVMTNDKYIMGGAQCAFQVSKTAGFSDVDASAWYAPYVYEAKDLTYMSGIAGTNLFMPLSDISRAELAQVFFNMAGQSTETGKYFPTQFADVDGWAWYAQPVDWAARAGVVTGYDAGTFGPTDKASRQQVAVMLYRYAKAQGKDVTVDDADAALAAYKDGDQVADWAKDAMAWAVENGVFGVDTDELYPTENIQRAAVAAITVRFQPEQLKK